MNTILLYRLRLELCCLGYWLLCREEGKCACQRLWVFAVCVCDSCTSQTIFKSAYAPDLHNSHTKLLPALSHSSPLWTPRLRFDSSRCCQADAETSCCGVLSPQPGNPNEQVSPILGETGGGGVDDEWACL